MKKTKSIIICMLIVIGCILSMYGIWAFILMNLDITSWSMLMRVLYVILTIGFSIISVCIYTSEGSS